MRVVLKYIRDNSKELFIGLIIALIAVVFLQKIFIIGTIPSESMVPILKVNDKVFIKTNYGQLQRGKVYAFKKGDSYLIKRCIGIPGDHIQINNDDVYLNGKKLYESYVHTKINKNKPVKIDITVPKNKVFFLGDNRVVSYDARYWKDKFVDKKNIMGVATKIIFPFNRIRDL